MRSTGLPHQAIVTEDEPTTLPRRTLWPSTSSAVAARIHKPSFARRSASCFDSASSRVSVLEHCHVWNEPGSRCVWRAMKWTAELLRKPAWWVLNQHLCVMESARKAERDKPERDTGIHQVVLTCDTESGRLSFFERFEDSVLTGDKTLASSMRPLSSREVNQNMGLCAPNISNFSPTPACHTVVRHPGTKV